MKKIILTVFAASSLLLCSTPSFAFSVSVGMPMSGTFSEGGEVTSIGGYFLGVQLPFAVGLGIDSYNTKVKDSTFELDTNIYNLFYQLPIPVINLILGIGTGSHQYKCADASEGTSDTVVTCESFYDKGSVTQWYTSIGMPIIPFFDIHLSYRSITSKNVKCKFSGCTKVDNSGSVTGIGIAFNF